VELVHFSGKVRKRKAELGAAALDLRTGRIWKQQRGKKKKKKKKTFDCEVD
jgi:hypothetical protein